MIEGAHTMVGTARVMAANTCVTDTFYTQISDLSTLLTVYCNLDQLCKVCTTVESPVFMSHLGLGDAPWWILDAL